MGNMRFKAGDRVRIKSIDWYNENKNKYGRVQLIYTHGAKFNFLKEMSTFCGKEMTITEVDDYECKYYEMKEDSGDYHWTDEMIEGLVEEETKPKYEDEVNGQYYSTPKYLVRPSGYQFVDENGNVINATKIVLEKKKKEYPKTYEECCNALSLGEDGRLYTKGYKASLIQDFQKLLICRDAYWKIAGEEMELGKPWESDNDYSSPPKYIISCYFGDIIKEKYCGQYNKLLSFPTEEMRDAFFENFKELIEQCKELL